MSQMGKNEQSDKTNTFETYNIIILYKPFLCVRQEYSTNSNVFRLGENEKTQKSLQYGTTRLYYISETLIR